MTSDWLADIIAKDSTITIFRDALFLTGMADTLRLYLDETYPKWGGDKTSVDSISEQGKIRSSELHQCRILSYEHPLTCKAERILISHQNISQPVLPYIPFEPEFRRKRDQRTGKLVTVRDYVCIDRIK